MGFYTTLSIKARTLEELHLTEKEFVNRLNHNNTEFKFYVWDFSLEKKQILYPPVWNNKLNFTIKNTTTDDYTFGKVLLTLIESLEQVDVSNFTLISSGDREVCKMDISFSLDGTISIHRIGSIYELHFIEDKDDIVLEEFKLALETLFTAPDGTLHTLIN